MHSVEDMLVEKNYSKCPLKKRPVTYQFDEAATKDIDCDPQPENLSLKKSSCDSAISSSHSTVSSEELINVSDCCEDEGVDVDHTDIDEEEEDCCDMVEEDDDDEMIDCVDIEENHSDAPNTTQAAALAAAAAMAASVVVPTPTYPKYGLQPWNFHMSPYTAEFYRTINNPHLVGQQQISPLRGDLLSPSSPSDSLGSLSPPPHYLHGRASSVSPPMRSEIIHRPIGVRAPQQNPPTHHHRFMPYALPSAAAYHAHAALTPTPAYPLGYHAATLTPHHTTLPLHPQPPHHGLHPLPINHHAPISPAYSESSFYSMRSLTPESNCSATLPEDLSVKHTAAGQKTNESVEKRGDQCGVTASSFSSATSSSGSPSKKEKSSAPPRYQCPDCQKSYSTFSGLTKHQQFHCPAAEGNQVKKSFSCKDCDKTYVSLGALKMHIRTHTLPCKCNICGKAFSRPWLLQGHIRTHTGEKPFSCQHCHRAFADRSNLRAHLQTHSDIKKYSCTNCSKTFSRMSLLTKHSEGGCSGSSTTAPSSGSEASSSSSYPAAVYAEH